MKAFKIYLKKWKEAINRLLQKPKKEYSPATFHRLRIEIKKLNAVIDLVKFCSKDFDKKDVTKPFNLIFRQAGKVRDLQIQEAMLKNYFHASFLKEYRNRLKKLRIKEQNKYFSIADKKFTVGLKKKYREIEHWLILVNELKVSHYMENKIKQIEQLLHRDTLQPSQVHTLRKRLKSFNYTRKFLNLEKQNNPLKEMDELPKILGDWHDCQVIIKNLEFAINHAKMNTEEMVQFEKIMSIVSSNSEILFKEILETVHATHFFPNQTGEINPPLPKEHYDQ